MAAFAMLILPVAPLGGALAGLMAGYIHTLGALLGIFAVLVLAIRQGILLLRHYQRLEREEGEPFGHRLLLRGARERLAPTLMSLVGTGLAVTPFLLLGDLPGYEVVRPMAVVIVGGLVTAALVNLFILPAAYLHVGPSPEPDEATQLVEQPGLSPA